MTANDPVPRVCKPPAVSARLAPHRQRSRLLGLAIRELHGELRPPCQPAELPRRPDLEDRRRDFRRRHAVRRRRTAGGRARRLPSRYQSSDDASIIKSSDNGRTWSNGFGTTDDPKGAAPPRNPRGTGAESMFPTVFTTPEFINYGKDDNVTSTADGGNRYVYAISNNGWAYDGSYMILGRVLRSEIGHLDAADWRFYTGPAGGNGMSRTGWSSDVSGATHIISTSHQLSQGSVTYIPGLHRYVLTSFYFPFNPQWPRSGYTAYTTWAFYQAPHPWGPWTLFYSRPAVQCYFSCALASASPIGLYDPALVPKFEAAGGLTNSPVSLRMRSRKC